MLKLVMMIAVLASCTTQQQDFDPTGTWSMQFQPLAGGDCGLTAIKDVSFDVEPLSLHGSTSYYPSIPQSASGIDGRIIVDADSATYEGSIYEQAGEVETVQVRVDLQGVIDGSGLVSEPSCSQSFAVSGELHAF